MTQQIGILFWGCKGGHRNFCDNGVIDVYSTEIRQTYKDVRSFATFSVVNTDFYAVEFTKDYKVYTHYRSSNDSGSGAFIALTIYVPHSLQVIGIRSIMDKMMDEYFAQYFNPITNSPIPGMIDDITPFQQMFEAYAAAHTIPDNSRFFKRPSKQDDTPKVLSYSYLDEVDAYFASPYHPEFFDCQEVMFISQEILQNKGEYGLRFLVQPVFIEHVSEPEPEPYINIFPSSKDFRLSLFKVNGVDHTSRQGDVPLYDTDRISLRIEGNKLQRPIDLDNVSLEEVVQKGIIKKNGRAYEFLPVYNLDYADFNVQAHIEGDDSGRCYSCFALRSLDTPNVIVPGALFDPRSGMFAFPVNGKYLDNRFQLIYSILPNFSIPTLIIGMKEVDVNMLIDQHHTLQLSVQKHILNFVYPDKVPPTLQFSITSSDKTKSIKGVIHNPGTGTELYLPVDFNFTPSDVQLSAQGYRVRLDQMGRYEIYPEQVDVEILIPKHLENFDLSALIPTYSIDNQTFKGRWQQQKCFISLPYEWSEKKGELKIDGISFPFEELSRTKLSFKCSIVNNRTPKTLGYDVIFEDNRKESRKLDKSLIDILPENVDIRIAPKFQSEAIVEAKGYTSDRKTKIFILVLRDMGPSAEAQGFDIDEQSKPNPKARKSTQSEAEERHPGQFAVPRKHAKGKNIQGNSDDTQTAAESGSHVNDQEENPETNVTNVTNEPDHNPNLKPQPATPTYLIKLVNCEPLFARILQDDNTYGVVPIANLDTSNFIKVNPEVRQVKLLDSREKEVCVVSFPESDYHRDDYTADKNAKNGFEVTWVDENKCIVTYKKTNFLSKVLNSFNSNKKLYAGVISILIIALISACWMVFVKHSEDYNLDLRFAIANGPEAKVDTVYSIASVGYKDFLYQGDSLLISNNGDILNCEPQANPLGNPSQGGVFSDLYVVYSTKDSVRIVRDKNFDTASEIVIFPEDIRVTQTITDTNKEGKKTVSTITWNIDSLFSLLEQPKNIDRNTQLRLELPPLSYLQAYQAIRSLPEIDNERVDTLMKVYPGYTERINKLREPLPAKPGETSGQDADKTATTAPEEGAEVANPGSEVVTPTEGVKASEGAKASEGTKASDETKTVKDNKVETAPVQTDPNAPIIAEYQRKIAELDEVFTKATVDEIVKYRDMHTTQLKAEIPKHNKKLIAYWNFVHGKEFNIAEMTQEQQAAINFAKKFDPDLYKTRDFPKIYNAYTDAGGSGTF